MNCLKCNNNKFYIDILGDLDIIECTKCSYVFSYIDVPAIQDKIITKIK